VARAFGPALPQKRCWSISSITAVKTMTLGLCGVDAFHDDFLTQLACCSSHRPRNSSPPMPLWPTLVRILAALGLLAGLDLALTVIAITSA